MNLSQNSVGLAVGSVYALWHLCWSILVAIGAAQTLLDWLLRMHFLNNPFRVEGFSFGTAAILIVVTFVIGYVLGWVFALLWNWFRQERA